MDGHPPVTTGYCLCDKPRITLAPKGDRKIKLPKSRSALIPFMASFAINIEQFVHLPRGARSLDNCGIMEICEAKDILPAKQC